MQTYTYAVPFFFLKTRQKICLFINVEEISWPVYKEIGRKSIHHQKQQAGPNATLQTSR
jgi:hypothetical protein